MKFSFKYLVVILIALSFGIASCNDDCDDPTNSECKNYDPCFGRKSINTSFKVRPGDRGFQPPEEWCDLISCDTFNASSVRFDIPEGNPENSSYEWQIGSETDTRVSRGFEVDFSDYLRDNGWEQWVAVTLTVRTPMNDCLESDDETVKTVTRDLFFTEKQLSIFGLGENLASYKGYFTNNPSEEVTIQFIDLQEGSFRGMAAPVFLTVGLPNIDTLLFPRTCPREWCYNFLHTKRVIFTPNICQSELSDYLSEEEWILLDGIQKLKRIWKFQKPTGTERYEFIGERF